MLKKYFPTFQHFVGTVVGLFFVFSGIIKFTDLIGFALKIEAYLSALASDIHHLFSYLLPYTLPIAIIVCMLEVILGVGLVGGFMRRLTLMALIGLTLFFTLLTGYTVWFKRLNNCGCLSEAIPLTPLQSLLKNILLLFLLGWLMRKNTLSSNATI